MTGQDDA
jgi:hypothetical protein